MIPFNRLSTVFGFEFDIMSLQLCNVFYLFIFGIISLKKIYFNNVARTEQSSKFAIKIK